MVGVIEAKPSRGESKLTRYAGAVVVVWTTIIAVSLFWSFYQQERQTREAARIQAQIAFEKDIVYRRWNAGHGGVYAPISETNQPNPYLAFLPNRDLTTVSGQRLTLINPAYMTRQIHELEESTSGTRGHITSLKPIRPENGPDEWERKALDAFEQGTDEVASMELLDDGLYFRLMRPFITEQRCLKCHAQQGYTEGDIRGGISVSIPMAPLVAIGRQHTFAIVLAHGVLWLVGLVGICLGARRIRQRVRERDQAEDRLLESESKHRRMIENLHGSHFLYTKSLDGALVYASPSLMSVLGYSQDEFRSHFQRHLTEDSINDKAEEHFKLTAKGRQQPSFEVEVIHKNGGVRRLELSEVPVLDAEGNAVEVHGIAQDITGRKRAEEEQLALERQVQHAQKLEGLGVLASGIAHDFNNILAAVLGYADLAMDDLGETHPALPSVREIVKGANRAADLTRQMLAYSGQGTFVIETLDVSALMDDMAHLLRTSISRSIALNLHLERPLPRIKADAAQMQQIVMNLITNAAEAIGDETGAIALATGKMDYDEDYLARNLAAPFSPEDTLPPGAYVYFEVSDTGCGMDEETQAKIFEPFFTTKFTGRGLGMAAVLGIVRGHKGAIMLDTEPGKGSTFRVLFPAAEGKRPDAAEAKRPMPVAQDAPRQGTVLVVDDEEAVRKPTVLFLERMGFSVLAAADGREAVNVFRKHADEIVCVFLDLTMPRMSGDACCAALRQIRNNVKVIIMSGYTEQAAIVHFPGKRPTGFLHKPFRQAALKEKIEEVLREESGVRARTKQERSKV